MTDGTRQRRFIRHPQKAAYYLPAQPPKPFEGPIGDSIEPVALHPYLTDWGCKSKRWTLASRNGRRFGRW